MASSFPVRSLALFVIDFRSSVAMYSSRSVTFTLPLLDNPDFRLPSVECLPPSVLLSVFSSISDIDVYSILALLALLALLNVEPICSAVFSNDIFKPLFEVFGGLAFVLSPLWVESTDRIDCFSHTSSSMGNSPL